MKEQDIFLIRHGKTALNAAGRALGQFDAELTEEGLKEVQKLALHLREKGISPQVIYTSPLKRAVETAVILREFLGGALFRVEELREINYGVHEGSNKEKLREIGYGYDSQKMHEGNAEVVEEVEQRITPFLCAVLEANNSSAFIVAHAFIASVMSQMLMDIPRVSSTIQPLATADYSHFRVERGGENKLNILTIQRNCLKGPLSI